MMRPAAEIRAELDRMKAYGRAVARVAKRTGGANDHQTREIERSAIIVGALRFALGEASTALTRVKI